MSAVKLGISFSVQSLLLSSENSKWNGLMPAVNVRNVFLVSMISTNISEFHWRNAISVIIEYEVF